MKKYKVIIFIICFLCVIGIIDAIFIVISNKSYPGTVTENPYQKGLTYNNVLHDSALQQDQNYHIEIESSKVSNKVLKYIVTLSKNGNYISDAQVIVNIIRPLGEYKSFQVEFNNIGNGLYQAEIQFPYDGQWELRYNIIHKEITLYNKDRVLISE